MIVLYAWYVIVLLHATRAGDRAIFAGAALILISAAVFWATHEVPLRAPIIAFLGLFGLTAWILQQLIKETIRTALTARFQAEDAHAQLEEALAEVSAERDAKARFIAAASHDLQQPIQAARLYFDMLSRATPRSRNAALSGGRAAFSAVESLLDDMLQHLRLESGAVQVAFEPVELQGLCEDLALQFTPAAAQVGLTIATGQLRETVMADRDLLRRALGNLVDNAIKHSGGSKVEIRARTAGEGVVVVCVQDDGRGMTAENVARLFDEDTRFRRVAGRSAPGFGLGMPSARQIACLLGGSLRLSSDVGLGCAFELTLHGSRP
jgi:signal transduction histidine kinase